VLHASGNAIVPDIGMPTWWTEAVEIRHFYLKLHGG